MHIRDGLFFNKPDTNSSLKSIRMRPSPGSKFDGFISTEMWNLGINLKITHYQTRSCIIIGETHFLSRNQYASSDVNCNVSN